MRLGLLYPFGYDIPWAWAIVYYIYVGSPEPQLSNISSPTLLTLRTCCFGDKTAQKLYQMKKRILLFLSVMMSVVIGCTDLDDVNNRLENLEMTVSNLQSALNALQQAYDDGKLISYVTPVEGMDGAWVITFSDATSIRLTSGADGKDGRDGITPYLLIDTDGYWCVSYDNGVTFSRLLDSNGNPIKAEGKKGDQGEKGDKGDKGENGEDGISVRIVVDENGFYVFQLYRISDPDTIIETITTPIDSNPDHLISSIVEDDVTHVITITMQNGKSSHTHLI